MRISLLAFLLIVCASCDIKREAREKQSQTKKSSIQGFVIEGQVLDVDMVRSEAIFISPRSSEDGEYPIGELRLLDIKTAKYTSIVDSVLFDVNSAKLVGAGRIGVLKGSILVYDVDNIKKEQLALNVSEDRSIVGFDSNDDGNLIAVIIKDYIHHNLSMKIFDRGVLKGSEIPLLKFEDSEIDEKLIVPTIWRGGTIIVAFMGKVLVYDLKTARVNVVTERLAYYHDDLIAATANSVLYYTFGEQHDLVLNEFGFASNSARVVKNSNVTVDYDRSSQIQLSTVFLGGKEEIVLEYDSKQYTYDSGRWIMRDRKILFENAEGVLVEQGANNEEFYVIWK